MKLIAVVALLISTSLSAAALDAPLADAKAMSDSPEAAAHLTITIWRLIDAGNVKPVNARVRRLVFESEAAWTPTANFPTYAGTINRATALVEVGDGTSDVFASAGAYQAIHVLTQQTGPATGSRDLARSTSATSMPQTTSHPSSLSRYAPALVVLRTNVPLGVFAVVSSAVRPIAFGGTPTVATRALVELKLLQVDNPTSSPAHP